MQWQKWRKYIPAFLTAAIAIAITTVTVHVIVDAAGDATYDTIYFDSGASTPTMGLGSAVQVNWSSATSGTGTKDVGLRRGAAGILSVSSGAAADSTGKIAAAKIGPSTTQQHTLPAVSDDTIALIAAAQTLTNKTIGAATVSGHLTLSDAIAIKLGTDADMVIQDNGTKTTIVPAVDDRVIEIGNGTTSADVKTFGNATAQFSLWDASADKLILSDSVTLALGTDSDLAIVDNGTKTTIVPAADDRVIEIGNGTLSADVKTFGNIATAYSEHDASASVMGLYGPMRARGFNTIGPRYELRWIAGQRGKPSLNAVIALDENSNSAAHLASNVADPDFEILGTSASTDDVTFYAEGGILIETDGVDGNEVIVLPHLDSEQTAWTGVTWGTDQETEWECVISTTANVTNAIIWAGLKLTNTEVTVTDNDQVFIRYEDDVNDGEWQAISSIANSDDAHDTNVAVAINTTYHLKITIDSSRVARFYINGALVETSSALTTATDLIPYIGVAADGAGAAKSLRVRGQAISRIYN